MVTSSSDLRGARRALLAVCTALCAFTAAASSATAAPLNGVSIAPITADSSSPVREIGQARKLGARTVRTELSWDDLEGAGRGRYDQGVLRSADRVFAAAHSRGMRVVLLMAGTPCWASSAPDAEKGSCDSDAQRSAASHYPPSDAGDFARIASFVAGRYRTTLRAFEVWNEPDQSNQLYFAGPDKANRYAALLRAAYPAIKHAAPGVTVLAGAIVGANGAFLKALYAAGIRGSYDALSVHYYDLVLYSLKSIRAVMRANHDSKPVWLAETGWSSCAPARLQDGQVCVSRKTQARNLLDLLQAVRKTSWVRAVIIYSLRDSSQYDLGLLDQAGRAKPSGSAMRKAFAHGAGGPRRITARLTRGGSGALLRVSGPAGDVYGAKLYVGGALRGQINFRLGAGNRYAGRLPAQLGSRHLRVRVFRFWDNRGATARLG